MLTPELGPVGLHDQRELAVTLVVSLDLVVEEARRNIAQSFREAICFLDNWCAVFQRCVELKVAALLGWMSQDRFAINLGVARRIDCCRFPWRGPETFSRPIPRRYKIADSVRGVEGGCRVRP